MIKITYYSAYTNMKNIYGIRYKIVRYALEYNVSAAAREFTTTRKTVRKWRDRYLKDGIKALVDQSKAPKNCPHKLCKDIEERIIKIRKNRKYLGPFRIIEEHNINASYGAVARVLKDAGLTRQRKKKYKVQRDLREVKQKMKPFEKIQIDLKELKDIPQYYPFISKGFPKYQFSARDVRTGITFLSYGYEKSASNVGIFLFYLLSHLKNNNVDLSKVVFQSDNGSEFIGSPKAIYANTPYQNIARKFNVSTVLIPPGAPTFNSDVEAMHRLIEDEFYDMEDYSDKYNFLNKAFTYVVYFNYLRKFRYKFGKTPFQILSEYENLNNTNYDFSLLAFYPIFLDSFINNFNFSLPITGYHVHISVKYFIMIGNRS